MALINTLYFDAEWQNKYDDSTETKFTTKDGQEKKIDGLYGSSDNYYELDNAIAFKRAYAGDYNSSESFPMRASTLTTILQVSILQSSRNS